MNELYQVDKLYWKEAAVCEPGASTLSTGREIVGGGGNEGEWATRGQEAKGSLDMGAI